MEAILENLTKEKFFSKVGSNNTGNSLPVKPGGIGNIGKIVIAFVIGSIVVYVFKDQIDSFFRCLIRNPIDKQSDNH